MSQWFGRKRNRQLGQAGLLQRCPIGGGGRGGEQDSMSCFGHDANMSPTPGTASQDGRRAPNRGAPFGWRQTQAGHYANANAHRHSQVRDDGQIWDQRFIDHEGVGLVNRTLNLQMNLFRTKRYLTILLMASLVTANYCCCLQSDNSLNNTHGAAKTMNRPANDDEVPVGRFRDPLKTTGTRISMMINGHQTQQARAPYPPESSKLEVMSASEKNSNPQPIVTPDPTSSGLLTISAMPSLGTNKIDHQQIMSAPRATNISAIGATLNATSLLSRNQEVALTEGVGNSIQSLDHHLDQLGAQSTQLVPRAMGRELMLISAASGDSLEPLVVSASKKKKKMMKKKKKKMEKKHKEWKKGKKHKKKKYESKKKKGGSSKKKKGKKEKKKWGMEKKGHKKKGNFKKKKWGHKKKMKKGHKKGKKGHKMLKDKGHKKKGFKKVYHKEEWGKNKKWHDIKREKKWNTKQKKWKKKWHQEKGKKYKGKHMKKYHKKNKHGKKYKKEKKSKWKKHKGEKFKKGHKKKKEEYSKKKEGGKKKKMKKEMKKMKKKG